MLPQPASRSIEVHVPSAGHAAQALQGRLVYFSQITAVTQASRFLFPAYSLDPCTSINYLLISQHAEKRQLHAHTRPPCNIPWACEIIYGQNHEIEQELLKATAGSAFLFSSKQHAFLVIVFPPFGISIRKPTGEKKGKEKNPQQSLNKSYKQPDTW